MSEKITGHRFAFLTNSEKPTGYLSKCSCGKITGVIDWDRVEPKEGSQILSQWLTAGKVIIPVFGSDWSVEISSCQCGKELPEADVKRWELRISQQGNYMYPAKDGEYVEYSEYEKLRDKEARLRQLCANAAHALKSIPTENHPIHDSGLIVAGVTFDKKWFNALKADLERSGDE